jgi:hypothetical protein
VSIAFLINTIIAMPAANEATTGKRDEESLMVGLDLVGKKWTLYLLRPPLRVLAKIQALNPV